MIPVNLEANGLEFRRRAVQHPLLLRRFEAADSQAVFSLLRELPTLYPGGGGWLRSRLADCASERAGCTVAEAAGHIVGVTLETPKGQTVRKLSTICVDPGARCQGIGTKLLRDRVENWIREGVDRAYVTVASSKAHALRPLLTSNGFAFTALEHDRYGEGRHEEIYEWSPEVYETDTLVA